MNLVVIFQIKQVSQEVQYKGMQPRKDFLELCLKPLAVSYKKRERNRERERERERERDRKQ
jgi:hypothetical protein